MAEMLVDIACGGTGGHTFPGLATGRVLAARGIDVEILSAGRAIEGATMKGWDGAVFATGAPKSPAKHLPSLCASVLRTWRRFRRRRPAALLAMGSYASLPPVLAARALGVPVVLHEANAAPGKAIATLSRFARVVALTFPECASRLPKGVETVDTGLPVRLELLEQPPIGCFADAPGAPRPATIFVTGGSQGAYAMNKRVAEALAALAARPGAPAFRVIHQTGSHADAEEWTRRRYAEAGIEARVFPFLPEMGGAYKVADLVVARAGAATCAEISLFGKRAVFIPLPSAAGDHQYLNARHFSDAGHATTLRQDECSPGALADVIAAGLAESARRDVAAPAPDGLHARGAAERLADLVGRVARRPHHS